MLCSRLYADEQSVGGSWRTTSVKTLTHHGPKIQRFIRLTSRKLVNSSWEPKVSDTMPSIVWL
jgi:hypothetical protein